MFDDIGVGITFVMKNIEETKGNITDLEKSLKGIGSANISRPVQEASKHTPKITKDLKKAWENAKKMGFALLTVRGIWFAIRKSMTTYLAQNEELQSKLDSIFYAVGSMFAPILEFLMNSLIKIISYVNVLVKALGLAGINMKNFNKSATEAKKTLLGIDEINNLNKSEGTSIFNLEDYISNLKLNDIVLDFATNLGLSIKDVFFTWDDLNSEQIMQKAIVAVSGATGALIGGIPGLFVGIMLGLVADALIFNHDGLLSSIERLKGTLLMAVALGIGGFLLGGGVAGAVIGVTLGVIVSLALTAGDVVEAKVNEGDISTALTTAVAQQESTIDIDRMNFIIENPQLASSDEIKEMFRLLGGECSEEQAKGYEESLKNNTLSSDRFFESMREEVLSVYSEAGKEAGGEFINAETQAITEGSETLSGAVQAATEPLTGIYEQLKEDSGLTGTSLITAMTSGVVDNQGEILKAWEDIKTAILSNWQEMEDGIKNSCNNIVGSVEGMLNSIISGFNSFARKMNGLDEEQKELMGIGFTLREVSGVTLPRLATGTNYVPRDMIAEIHQGEAVVPKEFNPSAFYGQNTAEELNLLAAINDNLERLNAKETSINLDGMNVAQTINNRIQDLKYRNGERAFAIAR